MKRQMLMAVVGLTAVLGSQWAMAQGPGGAGRLGGNFDPAEMQARMAERMKETLSATDEEWSVIEPRWQAVVQAQREQMTSRARGMFGRRGGADRSQGAGQGRPQRGGQDRPQGDDQDRPQRGQRPGFQGGETSPEITALQEALDAEDTSPAALQAKVEAVRAMRAKQASALQSAQAKLREVLTVKQEAILVLQGTL